MKEKNSISINIQVPEGSKQFEVSIETGMTLLDVLSHLQEEIDASISIRSNCRTGQCGICATRVNGLPRLVCLEKVLPNQTYLLEPICIDRHQQGLICDVSDLYREYFRTASGSTELERKLAFEQLLLRIGKSDSGLGRG
jgi:succinate dehydrogenase/fumarate reductase-like Fe-S protein